MTGWKGPERSEPLQVVVVVAVVGMWRAAGGPALGDIVKLGWVRVES